MRISDWSSDVCSSDLLAVAAELAGEEGHGLAADADPGLGEECPHHRLQAARIIVVAGQGGRVPVRLEELAQSGADGQVVGLDNDERLAGGLHQAVFQHRGPLVAGVTDRPSAEWGKTVW